MDWTYNSWTECIMDGLDVYEMDWMCNKFIECIVNGLNV